MGSIRGRPNILVTGTPGTGKTTTCSLLADDANLNLRHINLGELVKQKNLHDGWDEEFECYILNEDLTAEDVQKKDQQVQEEEEYVLLDFGGAFAQANFPPNTPYTLSGLDTMNPVLTIGDGLKLVGEYQETMGTCLVFSESAEEFSLVHEETGPSETNLFEGKCIVDPNQAPRKQIKNICQLHKVLKFKIVPDETADTKIHIEN